MKLKKISLRALNDSAIRQREQKHLLGGQECGCGCYGSSSYSANMSANYAGGLRADNGCNYTQYDGTDVVPVCRPHSY